SAAYYGRWQKARDLSAHAVRSAKVAGQAETAASYAALGALYEALLGNLPEARSGAVSAVALSGGVNVEYVAAVALAIARDTARAVLGRGYRQACTRGHHRQLPLRAYDRSANRAAQKRTGKGHRSVACGYSLRTRTAFRRTAQYQPAPRLYPRPSLSRRQAG